jgi:uncharacterized protein YndB with AHSA1/START domain
MAPDAAAVTLTRTLRAPRDLVFEAWTNPRHVAQWFAPLGFTGRAELDVRPGGALYIAMIGPDGTEYPIHGRYVEVTPTTRLVYIEDVTHHPQAWHDTLRELMAKHGAHHAPSQCLVTATFEAQGPAVTRLTLTRAESAGEIQASELRSRASRPQGRHPQPKDEATHRIHSLFRLRVPTSTWACWKAGATASTSSTTSSPRAAA